MMRYLIILVAPFLMQCSNNAPPNVSQVGKASNREIDFHLDKAITLEEDTNIPGPIEITNYQYIDGKIYILDSYKTQQAYIFDSDGRLINFVGRPGQGPGEYRSPGGFCRSGDRLHLTTGSLYLIYDLDGNYLQSNHEFITGGIPSRSHPGPGASAYYTTYSRHAPKATIFQISREGKLIRSFSPVDEDYALFWDMVLPLGLVQIRNDEIFQIFIHKYEIKVFDLNGHLKRNIHLATTIYNPPDIQAARELGPDKRTWSEFAKKYTLVNNFFLLGDGYVTGLLYSTYGKDREVLEFWDKDFLGLGRCLVPDGEMLVGTHEGRLVFYNGDTHVLSFHTVGY